MHIIGLYVTDFISSIIHTIQSAKVLISMYLTLYKYSA